MLVRRNGGGGESRCGTARTAPRRKRNVAIYIVSFVVVVFVIAVASVAESTSLVVQTAGSLSSTATTATVTATATATTRTRKKRFVASSCATATATAATTATAMLLASTRGGRSEFALAVRRSVLGAAPHLNRNARRGSRRRRLTWTPTSITTTTTRTTTMSSTLLSPLRAFSSSSSSSFFSLLSTSTSSPSLSSLTISSWGRLIIRSGASKELAASLSVRRRRGGVGVVAATAAAASSADRPLSNGGDGVRSRGYDPPPFPLNDEEVPLSSVTVVDDNRDVWCRHEFEQNGQDENSATDGRGSTYMSLEEEIADLERRMRVLNGGLVFNPNSPRQVSLTLFGSEGRSTARDALLDVVAVVDRDVDDDDVSDLNDSGNGDGKLRGDDRIELARLVLRHREAASELRRRQGRSKSSSRSNKNNSGTEEKKESVAVAVAEANGTKVGVRRIQNESRKFAGPAAAGGAAFSTNAGAPSSERKEANVNKDDDDDDDDSGENNNNNILDGISSPPSSTHHRSVRSLFDSRQSSIDQSWRFALESLVRPAARALVAQLNAKDGCPMGYDPSAGPYKTPKSLSSSSDSNGKTAGKKGSLLEYVRDQKKKYSDCIILTRVGEFYETFGIDAALLVEHCGLNPMAGKARAGCPVRNVQQTLDCLTNAGYRVAVYEEAGDTDSATISSSGGAKSRLKSRMLAQIVTGANPTYLYGLVLGDVFDVSVGYDGGDGGEAGGMVVGMDSSSEYLLSSSSSELEFSSAHSVAARPYVGIISTAAGYTLVEVSVEERAARVSERLTAEAVACRLTAYPPAEPLFYVPPPSGGGGAGDGSFPSSGRANRPPFLPSRTDAGAAGRGGGGGNGVGGGASRLSVRTLPPALLEEPGPDSSDAERAKRCVVSSLLRTSEMASEFLGPSDFGDFENDNDGGRRLRLRKTASSVTHEDFVLVENGSAPVGRGGRTRANPLHVETATQLGLLSDPTIPPLVSYLLPESAPAAARRFLRRWLLVPPPPEAADAMSDLVRSLKGDDDDDDNDNERGKGGVALPPLSVPPVGKVLALIRAGQASASVYRELLRAMDATVMVLGMHDHDSEVASGDGSGRRLVRERLGAGLGVVRPLMVLLRHETGLASNPLSLRDRCFETMKIIQEVVAVPQRDESCRNDDDVISDYGEAVPRAFFERNEITWRGRVRPSAAKEAYDRAQLASKRLAEAVAVDFWGSKASGTRKNLLHGAVEARSPVVQDVFNNIVALKQIPTWATGSAVGSERYYHPRDRNGKQLRNRYTTKRVESALSEYVEACEGASAAVARALTELSEVLRDGGHLPAVVQAAHANLILSAAAHHAARSNFLGWNVVQVQEQETVFDGAGGEYRSVDHASAHFEDMWPYWMDRTGSVHNNFTLTGMFLLTAPNMSGKSTLMRSTAAVALLANCGLAAPVGPNSFVRRFDSLFVRGASADIPTEDKSAFGAEMGDVASLLRSFGDRSLVFVDELGRGTSPRDGTALAGAVLEAMLERGMSGMFATHLHGILELPFSNAAKSRLIKKRMAFRCKGSDNDFNAREGDIGEDEASRKDATRMSHADVEWTYKLEDGVCTDSFALVTAARFGLPKDVLRRAEELSDYVRDGDNMYFASEDEQESDSRLDSEIIDEEFFDLLSNSRSDRSCDADVARLSLTDAMEVVEAIARGDSDERFAAVHIPPLWMPPASMEGSSCVYVMELEADRHNTNSLGRGVNVPESQRYHRYYVGETDSLSNRLRQHRAKGSNWANGAAIAVRISNGGKSAARNVESLVIQKMAKMGFDMISVTDGRSIRRSNCSQGE